MDNTHAVATTSQPTTQHCTVGAWSVRIVQMWYWLVRVSISLTHAWHAYAYFTRTLTHTHLHTQKAMRFCCSVMSLQCTDWSRAASQKRGSSSCLCPVSHSHTKRLPNTCCLDGMCTCNGACYGSCFFAHKVVNTSRWYQWLGNGLADSSTQATVFAIVFKKMQVACPAAVSDWSKSLVWWSTGL